MEEQPKYTEVSEEKLMELVSESELVISGTWGGQNFDFWRHPSGAVIVFPTQVGLIELMRKADEALS